MMRISDDSYHVGWTIGGGAEYKITRSWSIKGEYMFLDLGDVDYDPTGVTRPDPNDPAYGPWFEKVSADLELHTVRVGLNYHFDSDREPVVPLK